MRATYQLPGRTEKVQHAVHACLHLDIRMRLVLLNSCYIGRQGLQCLPVQAPLIQPILHRLHSPQGLQ